MGAPCSINFYTEVGHLTSPNYPDLANDKEECDYLLKIASAYSIRLVVEFFETEMLKDFLTFGPGPTVDIDLVGTDPGVVNLTGYLVSHTPTQNSTSLTFTHDTNQVWFNWYADKTITSNGFNISWNSGEHACCFSRDYISTLNINNKSEEIIRNIGSSMYYANIGWPYYYIEMVESASE